MTRSAIPWTDSIADRVLGSAVDAAARPGVTDALHLVKLCAAGALLSPFGGPGVRSGLGSLLSVTTFVLAPRHHYGGDGSDQVGFLVQGLTTIARANHRRPELVDAALWTIALQGTLAYAVSGWVKLAGARWRRHEAIVGVLRTRCYGNEKAWNVLRDRPWAQKLLGTVTLVLECGFPLVYATRGRGIPLFLGATSSMHLGIAAVMALGRFVPAFHSFYPAIAYTAQSSRVPAPAAGRSDLVPAWVAAMVAVGWPALLVESALRRRRVTAPREGASAVTLRGGAMVDVVVRRPRDDDSGGGALVVFENGLASLPEFWSWIEDALVQNGHTTVTWYRPGYGPSTGTAAERGFTSLTDGLVDLVEWARSVEPERPVILVGHSLGGYLAHRVTSSRPDLVAAAVVVDATHPHQLVRSVQQSESSQLMRSTFALASVSMRLGLGRLMKAQTWYRHFPGEVRARIEEHCRDERLWRAASREWEAALEEFERVDGVDPIHQPLVVVSAGRSVVADAEVASMHEELRASSARGRRVVVDDASHEGILFERRHADRVAAEILDVAASEAADVAAGVLAVASS